MQYMIRHKSPPKGIALILVIMVSMIVLGIVLTGLEVTSKNALFIASIHYKHAALSAAEGGIYKAIARLEQNPTFSGSLEEQLGQAAFKVTVTNRLASDNKAILVSTGTAGRFTKTIKVVLQYSGEAYEGIGSEGQILIRGHSYANGVRSLKDPMPEPVLVHTNSSAPNAVSTMTTIDDRLSVKGIISAVGSIPQQGIDAITRKVHQPKRELQHLDKTKLLQVGFTKGELPANGLVNTNLEVDHPVDFPSTLVLKNGAVIHIKGDGVFYKGITGEGTVVADGSLYIHGVSNIDLNSKGVILYSDEDIVLAHPTARQQSHQVITQPVGSTKKTYNPQTGSPPTSSQPQSIKQTVKKIIQDTFTVTFNEVGDYFAQMPSQAPYQITRSLPPNTPQGIQFFNWYRDQSQNPSPAFKLWRDGDGTELNPGLPTEVKQWLDKSIPINQKLNSWYQQGG